MIEDGVTGFVVDSMDGAVEAMKRIGELDRRVVRKRFEERFTSDVMASNYLRLYRALG